MGTLADRFRARRGLSLTGSPPRGGVLTTQPYEAHPHLSGAALWSEVAAAVDELMIVLDREGRVVEVNEAWRRAARAAGASGDFIGFNYLAVCEVDDEYAQKAGSGIRGVLGGEVERFQLLYPFMGRWYRLRATRLDGNPHARAVVVHADITDDEARYRLDQQRARLIDEIDVAVTRVGARGEVVDWNRGAERVFGWTRDEVVGRLVGDVLWVDPAAGVWTEGETQRPNEHQVVMRRKDGSSVPVRHRIRQLDTGDGLHAGELSVILDATHEAAALAEIVATRDFLEAVTDSMAEGVIVLDARGHAVFMNPAAQKLSGWTIAEISELAVHDVIHAWRPDGSPYPSEECPIMSVCDDHIGVHVADDTFFRRDGSALPVTYTTSPLSSGEGCVLVFNDATELRAEARRLRKELADLTAKDRVREILQNDQLRLYAQPIVRLDTGEVAQHELLLRVLEPDGTVTGPVDYLADAERLGLAREVDRWVVQRGIQMAADLHQVEVNLSATSLDDPELLDAIATWLARYDVDPADITFEITETALLANVTAGQAFVAELHKLGCLIALDDFGTGYGGFTYLKKLDVDILKIDIEFVSDLLESQPSRHVVEAVVNLARSFGIQTIAEGVEDQETLDVLRELGVDFAQGYYLGKPVPPPRPGEMPEAPGPQAVRTQS